MEGTVTISIAMFEEMVLANARCKMVEKLVQNRLNADDNYVHTEYLAVILGLEKEKKNENQ